ncbi:hypothetical protein Hden_0662 [Hyphomicrobium denitrificans ATCC 51888]|uniref:Uncharacterized protein n=1 Tax=Hyphomicrobium denitrificans (strain ATCC 51888 / DSM 1869 / NCIMB 11706 / TK 0415) TaxID=582899 RepID=D8JSZ8_HYPDA|nr:hypothetical protein Hden_0662 [Hyphomicrobium denitrificans ATCC 51888]
MTLAFLLAPPCAPDAEPDKIWFLDRGRRLHRLRRAGAHVVASRRNGQSFHVPWPVNEPVLRGEAFAAHIFAICSQTKTATDS